VPCRLGDEDLTYALALTDSEAAAASADAVELVLRIPAGGELTLLEECTAPSRR
jgi:hypothetical protein